MAYWPLSEVSVESRSGKIEKDFEGSTLELLATLSWLWGGQFWWWTHNFHKLWQIPAPQCLALPLVQLCSKLVFPIKWSQTLVLQRVMFFMEVNKKTINTPLSPLWVQITVGSGWSLSEARNSRPRVTVKQWIVMPTGLPCLTFIWGPLGLPRINTSFILSHNSRKLYYV